MVAITREKIALVVFLFLIVIGLGALISYLAIGHSWNVAASNIDDVAGSMDGYTVILYEGTVDDSKTKTDKDTSAESKDTTAEKSDTTGSDTSLNNGDGDTPGNSLSESGTDDKTEKKKPVDIGSVEEDYEAKNATVLILDLEDPSFYRDGVILKKGDRRFGVFCTTPDDTKFQIDRQMSYFRKYQVDFSVVLTSDIEMIKDVKGADIVISTNDESLFVMGETIDGTFYTSAPPVGSVGVIIISPSNVVSAKVLNG